jgi:hypothetical protein
MSAGERTILLLDPTEDPQVVAVSAAPRLARLAGARLAIVDNGKFRASVLLAALAAELERRHGARLALTIRKPAAGRPLTPADLDHLARAADAVLNGVGD